MVEMKKNLNGDDLFFRKNGEDLNLSYIYIYNYLYFILDQVFYGLTSPLCTSLNEVKYFDKEPLKFFLTF